MPEHHKVIIAAVARALAGERARILRIRPVAERSSAWTRLGRLAIQGSHSLPSRAVRQFPDPGGFRR
ncbi:MAG: hypothetical protein ACE15B_08680 [Bryobacteraceae bacterium]